MNLHKILILFVATALVACQKQPSTDTPAPEPTPEPTFVAQYSSGVYYGDEYSPGVDNYFISLSDNGFTEEGYVKPSSTYYRLDLYAPMYEGEWSEWMTLPVGEYLYDANDTMAAWTFSADYSQYVTTSESEITAQLKFDSGKLIVTETLTTLIAVVAGEEHVVTFAGEHLIANAAPKPMEGRTMVATAAYAIYYGDKFTPSQADNFYLYLSDKGLDEAGFEQAGGSYYAFDLYTACVDDMTLPYDTYAWDDGNSLAAGTISAYYTKYYRYNDEGTGYSDSAYPTHGTLTVDAEGITAEVWFDDVKHTITFVGTATIYPAPSE